MATALRPKQQRGFRRPDTRVGPDEHQTQESIKYRESELVSPKRSTLVVAAWRVLDASPPSSGLHIREAVGEVLMNAQINNGAVRILRDYTGRGPTTARSVIDHNSVMILMGDTLTPGERRLADAGRADHVINNRHELQRLMRDDLVKVVEDALDRKVIALPHRSRHGNPSVRAGAEGRVATWTLGSGLGQFPSRRDWSADTGTCGRDSPQSLGGQPALGGPQQIHRLRDHVDALLGGRPEPVRPSRLVECRGPAERAGPPPGSAQLSRTDRGRQLLVCRGQYQIEAVLGELLGRARGHYRSTRQ
jgi:uncharacterized protein YbcI